LNLIIGLGQFLFDRMYISYSYKCDFYSEKMYLQGFTQSPTQSTYHIRTLPPITWPCNVIGGERFKR